MIQPFQSCSFFLEMAKACLGACFSRFAFSAFPVQMNPLRVHALKYSLSNSPTQRQFSPHPKSSLSWVPAQPQPASHRASTLVIVGCCSLPPGPPGPLSTPGQTVLPFAPILLLSAFVMLSPGPTHDRKQCYLSSGLPAPSCASLNDILTIFLGHLINVKPPCKLMVSISTPSTSVSVAV